MVGGTTFSEAKELSAMKNVLLGSTTLLNSE